MVLCTKCTHITNSKLFKGERAVVEQVVAESRVDREKISISKYTKNQLAWCPLISFPLYFPRFYAVLIDNFY